MPRSTVTSIKIERFKRIREALISLKRVNILVGANNSSKSSVLHAIQFAISIAQSGKLFAPHTRRYYSGTLAAQQLLYSPLREVEALAPNGRFTQGSPSAIRVTLDYALGSSVGNSVVAVSRGKNRNLSYQLSENLFTDELADLDNPFAVYVTGLAGIPSEEEFKSPGVVRKAAARGDANSVFRNVLWQLRQDTEGWNQFSEDLKRIFPGVDCSVAFNDAVDDYITATIGNLPVDAAGTGVLQTIQILSYVNVYRPALLLLDEPDSHLHPSNQRLLAQTLVDVASRRDIQIILATHSRHMIDELADVGNVVWLSNGAVRQEGFDKIRALVDLGAMDRVDKLAEGRYEFFVLSEDTDTTALEVLVSCSALAAASVVVRSYQGCTQINAAMLLASYIHGASPDTRILLHRDRDYETDVEIAQLEANLHKAGLLPIITAGTDIESAFLNVDHLCEIMPDITRERHDELLLLATNTVREKSIEKLTNARGIQAAAVMGGLGRINIGSIASESRAEYESKIVRFRYGKAVVGALKNLLQRELGRNVSIFVKSTSLANVEEVRSISNAGASDARTTVREPSASG